jgi:hypothetical protein
MPHEYSAAVTTPPSERHLDVRLQYSPAGNASLKVSLLDEHILWVWTSSRWILHGRNSRDFRATSLKRTVWLSLRFPHSGSLQTTLMLDYDGQTFGTSRRHSPRRRKLQFMDR